MRPLRRPCRRDALDARTARYLARKTRQARLVTPRDPWIERIWKSFGRTVARRRVDEAIDAYAHGKCAYCEQVDARDIEHFRPRSAYPSRMLAWKNFLRSCSVCNGAKHDRFPLDAMGRRLLIEPCEDDPMDYFEWDLRTGATGLNPHPDRRARAEATRDLLRLDRIMDERLGKIQTVLFLLVQVLLETPVSPELRRLLQWHLSIRRPYLGIVRQLFLRPPEEYRELVRDAQEKHPEIRDWIDPWC
ncbi:MAG: retron system putative HNH endonuclease [Isosphaeraceae bacterium]